MRSYLAKAAATALVGGLFFGAAAARADQPAEGAAARIGEKIDRGLEKLGSEIRRGWQDARNAIDKLGIEGRVYGRLKWDKHLENAQIEIDSRETGVVVLKGTVATSQAKAHAAQVARDTVGVKSVVDELGVAAPDAATTVTN